MLADNLMKNHALFGIFEKAAKLLQIVGGSLRFKL